MCAICEEKKFAVADLWKFEVYNAQIRKAQSRQSAKCFSSRWNWDSPTPLAAGECAPPPFGPGGRAHSLAAKGVGESQFQRRTYTVVLCIYKYFVPQRVTFAEDQKISRLF